MKESIREEYLDYIDNIKGLSDEKYDELVDLFDNELSEKDSIKLKIFIDGYKEQEVYNYRLLNETLKDIVNDNIIAKEEEKEPEIIEFETEEEPEEEYEEESEEDYEEENEVEEPKKAKKIGPFKRFYYNHIKKYDYVDGELEPIEIEEPKKVSDQTRKGISTESAVIFKELLNKLGIGFDEVKLENGNVTFMLNEDDLDLESSLLMKKYNMLVEEIDSLKEKYPDLKELITNDVETRLFAEEIHIHIPVAVDSEWFEKRLYSQYIHALVNYFYQVLHEKNLHDYYAKKNIEIKEENKTEEKEPEIIELEAEEEPEEEYEEENEVEETKKPKKIGPFKRFYYNHIKKYDYVDGELEPIEIEEAEEKKGFFKKIKDKIKSIFKKDENKKINYIKDFVNDNYLENDEIMSFMDLLEEREDKEKIVNKLYRYVKYSTDALDEDKFIDKLYNLFELAREDEYEEPIKKVEEPEIIEEKAIEEPKIVEEKAIEEPIKKVEEPKKVKKSTRDITKLSDNYKERMKELRNEYTEYEIMFIEDAHSECLELGDQEFDQMLNERCIDKRRIYKYLLEVEKIKLLNVYDNLDEYEKMFIDDAHSECLELGDQEFDQMLNERRINKEVIIKFYEILNKSKENQDKIIANCKKEFLKLNDVNLEDKKVKELKEIAKDNDMKTTSKMKKAELINMLNELKKLKEEDLNKRLGLTK